MQDDWVTILDRAIAASRALLNDEFAEAPDWDHVGQSTVIGECPP